MDEHQDEREPHISVRVPPQLRDAVVRVAAEQHRTVSDQVRYWLTQATQATRQERAA
jgi:hypothetical protein